MAVLTDPAARRCPSCGQNLRRRPPVLLGQAQRTAAHPLPSDFRPPLTSPESGDLAASTAPTGGPNGVARAPRIDIDLTVDDTGDRSEEPAREIVLTEEPDSESAPETEPADPGGAAGPTDSGHALQAATDHGPATHTLEPDVEATLDELTRRVRERLAAEDPDGTAPGSTAADPLSTPDPPWLAPPRRAWEPPEPPAEAERRRRPRRR